MRREGRGGAILEAKNNSDKNAEDRTYCTVQCSTEGTLPGTASPCRQDQGLPLDRMMWAVPGCCGLVRTSKKMNHARVHTPVNE